MSAALHFESRAGAPPTGRLAPSPTGPLHLGHARAFLIAWWSARAAGGRVLLRIEDIDRARCRPEYADSARADLEWLGLDWDGPVWFQSADPTPYRVALDTLLASGAAYPCTCSRSDIAARVDAPHAGDGELRYPGTCRGRWPSVAAAQAATGLPAGVRLRLHPALAAFDDRIHGRVEGDAESDAGDVLLLRRDGLFAYQLAVVVDDARQGIDAVVRGDDLLPSTLRQGHLQRALDLPHPTWAHVPLVVDPSGRRLAKRDGDTAIGALRAAGVDPRAVVSAIAGSAGMSGEGMPGHRERLHAREWTPQFHIRRVPRAPVTLEFGANDAPLVPRFTVQSAP